MLNRALVEVAAYIANFLIRVSVAAAACGVFKFA